MTDADRIEALFDIVDETRTETRDRSERLAIEGYVSRIGRKGFWPTTAGWKLLADRGRAFDVQGSKANLKRP